MRKVLVLPACLTMMAFLVTCQNINITDDQEAVSPTFDVVEGTYVAPKTILITTSTENASIRYTLDGTAPSKTAGTLYSGSLILDTTGTITVKAVAYTDTLLASSIAVAVYKIVPEIIPAPETVTASPANASVVISWTSVEGAVGYNVYYKAGTTAAKTDTKSSGSPYTGTTATISGLTNGTAYAFIVTTYDAEAESDASDVVTATPSLVVPVPMKPVLLPLSREVGKTTADWDPVFNVASYTLYFSEGSTVTKADYDQVVSNIPSTTTVYEVTGLTNAQEYAFIVTATNAGGEGPASDIKTVKPGIAGVPTNVVATATNSTSTSITWQQPEGLVTITGYKVYGSTPTPLNVVLLDTVDSSTLAYNHTGLTKNTDYYYWVKASTAAGDSDFSSQTMVRTPDLEIPGTPGATAVADLKLKKVAVTITAPASGGEVEYYKIYCNSVQIGTRTSTGIYEDTRGTLEKNTAYSYTVSAYNATGESPQCAASVATGNVPPTPTVTVDMTKTGRDFANNYTYYYMKIGAVDITSTNATGSHVTVSRSGYAATDVFNGNNIFTNTEPFEGPAGLIYPGYNLVISWSGHTYNEWGDSGTDPYDYTFADADQINGVVLTNTKTANSITLNWTAPVDVFPANRYAVYSSTSISGPWNLSATYTLPGSHAFLSLPNGTYYYGVVAYNFIETVAGNMSTNTVTLP